MAIKTTSANLFLNSTAIANNTRLVKSKRKEDEINASEQVPPGGTIVIVSHEGVAYAKLTDGQKTFAELKRLGEGEDAGSVEWSDVQGKPTTFAPIIGTTSTTAKAGNAAPLAHTQAFTTITGVATAAQIPALTIAKTTGLQAAIDAKLTATTAQFAAKAPLESPAFTGTVTGITKAMVGLGSVDNTTDLLKPISTATQTALTAKLTATAAAFNAKLTATKGVAVADAVDEQM